MLNKFTPKVLKVNRKSGDITISVKDFSDIMYRLGYLEILEQFIENKKELK